MAARTLILSCFCILVNLPNFSSSQRVTDSSTLQMVHVLYRHGDRSPISEYPTDTKRGIWPNGLGQLTNLGKQQQYQLGEYLKNRYAGFVNSSYDRDEIIIRSTDKDRTLMSAYSNLAGFYPPTGADKWNPNILWQPIPVHTVPKKEDLLLYMESECPKYMEIYLEFQQSPTHKNLLKDYQNLMDLISKKAGVKHELEAIASVYDTLFCKLSHNMSLPIWATEKVMQDLRSLTVLKFQMYFYLPMMRILRGGVLLGTIIDNMILKVTEPGTLRKINMYSAHDTTLVALLMSMEVFDHAPPPYASCLMIELHEDKNQSHFVEIYYKNSTSNEQPHLLQIPGCQEQCPWDRFLYLTKEAIPQDIDKQCEVTHYTFPTSTTVMVPLVIFFIVAIITAMLCIRSRRRDSYRHIRV